MVLFLKPVPACQKKKSQILCFLETPFILSLSLSLFFFYQSFMSNFKEVCIVPTDFGVSFTKLKSERTGLTVMLADIEGNL